MKVSELVRMLTKAGCFIHRHGSNHDIWYSPITKQTFPVPRHESQEMRDGTLKSIRKWRGFNPCHLLTKLRKHISMAFKFKIKNKEL